jgi:hypothetical protein
MKYYCKKCKSVFEPGVIKSLVGYNCPMCKEVMEHIPYYETPKQWEKRTGRQLSEDVAVWVKCEKVNYGKDGIEIDECCDCEAGERWNIDYFEHFPGGDNCNAILVIADPPIPPPDDWKPEKEVPHD